MNMISLLLSSLLLLRAIVQITGYTQSNPTIHCRLSLQKPVIDGILDDACWKKAERVTGFSLLGRRGKASEQTTAMVSYDADNLYVAFICLESRMDGVRNSIALRDGAVWLDDCVEVFMDPSNRRLSYYHLITNLNATRFDEVGGTRIPVPNPASWNPEWEVATGRFDSGWTVELAIPFRSMNRPTPRAGTLWGFNLNREEYRLSERSSWSETRYWFHEPRNFGNLLFEPPS